MHYALKIVIMQEVFFIIVFSLGKPCPPSLSKLFFSKKEKKEDEAIF